MPHNYTNLLMSFCGFMGAPLSGAYKLASKRGNTRKKPPAYSFSRQLIEMAEF